MNLHFGPDEGLATILDRYEYREGQEVMAEAVLQTLGNGEILLVEAGTGTGKTLAYLIPAVESGLKVVVSTGTLNLQEQIIKKDIPILQKLLGDGFKTACMKGRGNYLCKRRFKNFSQQPLFKDSGEGRFFTAIQKWADSTKSGDRADMENMPDDYIAWSEINSKSELCLGQACPTFDSCFITKMREDAAVADIVVVNHHLFFADLNIRDSVYGEVIPRYDAVIFDEAHNVEETATNYFGHNVSNYRIDEAVRDTTRELASAKTADKDVTVTLSNLSRRSHAFFDSIRGGQEGKRRLRKHDVERTKEQAEELLNTIRLVGDFISSMKKAPDNIKALSGRFMDIADMMEGILSLDDDSYVYCVETRGRGVFLQSFPIDVSGHLQEKLYPIAHACVFTSATLSTDNNFKFIKSRLGLTEVEEHIIESPFDYKRQTVFYIAADLPEPNSDKFAPKAAERIKALLKETKGRAFVLFTSYRNLEMVWDLIDGKTPFTMLKQGDSPRSVILEKFRKDTHSVLFATTSFWQGVDVPGETLSAVIIDKLPFATPSDPQVAARIEAIEKRGSSAFREYQLPSAALMLKQGLGRLIRSKEDKGLLAVLDKRMATKSYGKTFLRSLPEFNVHRELDDLVKSLHEMWDK